MDTSNYPEHDNSYTDTTPENTTAAAAPSVPSIAPYEAPQAPAGRARNWMKFALLGIGILLLLACSALAYFAGKGAGETEATEKMNQNISTSATTTEPSDKVDSEPKAKTEVPTEENDVSTWSSYTNPVYGYSFKYPADWQVERKVVQEPHDWVSINANRKSEQFKSDLVAITTYADGTGCGMSVDKQFTIAGFDVTGTADCESPVYLVNMRSQAGKLVIVRIDTASGEDEAVRLLLESITGLSPLRR